MNPPDLHPVVVASHHGQPTSVLMVRDTYPSHHDPDPLSVVDLTQPNRRGYRLIRAFTMAHPDEPYLE